MEENGFEFNDFNEQKVEKTDRYNNIIYDGEYGDEPYNDYKGTNTVGNIAMIIAISAFSIHIIVAVITIIFAIIQGVMMVGNPDIADVIQSFVSIVSSFSGLLNGFINLCLLASFVMGIIGLVNASKEGLKKGTSIVAIVISCLKLVINIIMAIVGLIIGITAVTGILAVILSSL